MLYNEIGKMARHLSLPLSDDRVPLLYHISCFIFSWKRQEGVDLGERMRNAVQDCFDMGEDRVVIIGKP